MSLKVKGAWPKQKQNLLRDSVQKPMKLSYQFLKVIGAVRRQRKSRSIFRKSDFGAGTENRTPIYTLEVCYSTIKLYPRIFKNAVHHSGNFSR